MAQKPSIPKGTRDFSPEEMVRRNFIFDTIKNVFQLYGYLPIETPAMENLSSLLGKYGEEGDRLLFKVLNSGDFLNRLASEDFSEGANKMSLKICEKGLRYDLTVPFARYVVQNRNDITFPFKRYQVQPVWRADRPQKGRYREFYQCDADIIGSDSLLNEVEFVNIIDQVFSRLNIPVTIKINNRKILAGIAEVIGEKDRFADITVAMDKLEKIGQEKVMEELRERGLGETALAKLAPFLHLKGDNSEKLSSLNGYFQGMGTGEKGIREVQTIFDFLDELTLNNEVEFDITLARGLNYYTGAIFEVKAKEVSMGSVCGGGRYDDLTGIFGLPGVSGVGISFGADRIYDVMEQSGLFPENTAASTRLLFVNFGDKEARYCLKYIAAFRAKGINTELYPDPEKMKKQMGYANKKNIPFVAIVGENEINNNTITLKDMISGEQQEYILQELIHKLK